MSKILVSLFSATGTTRKVAEEICKVENGDLYEIVPETPYTKQDLDYTVKDSRSNVEMADESSRPAFVKKCDSIADYDTVFVGFPVWWGREPSIIDTFLEAYDFSGKTIIPFLSHGGYGPAGTLASIEKAAPGADVEKNVLALAGGREMNSARQAVSNWLRELRQIRQARSARA